MMITLSINLNKELDYFSEAFNYFLYNIIIIITTTLSSLIEIGKYIE